MIDQKTIKPILVEAGQNYPATLRGSADFPVANRVGELSKPAPVPAHVLTVTAEPDPSLRHPSACQRPGWAHAVSPTSSIIEPLMAEAVLTGQGSNSGRDERYRGWKFDVML